MMTLPQPFDEKNRALENRPTYIVSLETDDSLSAESTTQADWQANTGSQNVDTASSPGDVTLLAPARVGNSSGWKDFQIKLAQDTDGDGTPDTYTTQTLWQGFTPQASGVVSRVAFLMRSNDPTQAPETLKVEIWDSTRSTLLGSVEKTTTIASYDWVWFDFPLDEGKVEVTGSTTYWLAIFTTSTDMHDVEIYYHAGGNPYPGGEMHTDPTDDACFRVEFGYPSSGHIITKTLDLGQTPARDGEWVLEDTVPMGTSMAYQGWASDTGAFNGEEVSLGTIEDGDAITVKKRYYRVRADLSTTDPGQTPVLYSIKAYFPDYMKLSSELTTGYESAVLAISALETTIHTFKPSTIGTISIGLALTGTVTDYLTNHHPPGKRVIVRAGFDGIGEADYIHYYTGVIDRYKLSGEGRVSMELKDASRTWKKRLPQKWESTTDDIVWTDAHPVDCMLDILERIGIRSAFMDMASFSAVRESLTGWNVTRTLTGNTYEADKLLEELRRLTSTYFIPRGDGRVRLKLYDPDEPAVAELTDDVLVSIGWDANTEGLLNGLYVYYGWNGGGEELKDFSGLYTLVDAQSSVDWGSFVKETKDKWTQSGYGWQVEVMAQNIVTRYAKKPVLLDAEVDRYFIWLEVGDMVSVTSTVPPGGIQQKKFQVVRKNLDFSRDTIKLKLLEV